MLGSLTKLSFGVSLYSGLLFVVVVLLSEFDGLICHTVCIEWV